MTQEKILFHFVYDFFSKSLIFFHLNIEILCNKKCNKYCLNIIYNCSK